MVYKTRYSVPASMYPNTNSPIVQKTVETYPGTNVNTKVAYIFGFTITQNDIAQIVKKTSYEALRYINSRIGSGVSIRDCSIIKVFTPFDIYTIIMPGGVSKYNQSTHKIIFNKDFHFVFSLDLLNLPQSFRDWINVFKGNINDVSYPTLVNGQFRTAVQYDGNIGAMTLKKQ